MGDQQKQNIYRQSSSIKQQDLYEKHTNLEYFTLLLNVLKTFGVLKDFYKLEDLLLILFLNIRIYLKKNPTF